MASPLAYLITWTTYGTWLPGDDRGWVEDDQPGIKPPDSDRRTAALAAMKEACVVLDPEQREIVKKTIEEHCRIRGWTLLALNVRSNHVHLVVVADRKPEEVMNQLKAWCSRRLNEHSGTRRWWTKHGSTKWINDKTYLANAIRYVNERQ